MTNETKNSLLQTDGINIAETPNPYSASTITKLFEIRSPEPITFDKIPENNGNGFTIEFLDSETRYPIASKKVSRSLKQFETAF